jgi:hypothetical protein
MGVAGVANEGSNKTFFLTPDQENFITYVRTKQIFSLRLRTESDDIQPIHIPTKEIEEVYFPYPKCKRKDEIKNIVDAQELKVTEIDKRFYYEVLKPGKINFDLIKAHPLPDDPIFKAILYNIQSVSLPDGAESTDYFDLFLRYKTVRPELFLKVDSFAGRVHSPISNFHRTCRPFLLINGEETTSLDVVTMQPLLLGKILTNYLVNNEYSRWINEGEDIYIKLQQKANLQTRDQAKKKFFEILFSKPSNSLAALFGQTDWITWINNYKSKVEPLNPHGKLKVHSNLAWLLQSTEVKIMIKVWKLLAANRILFLPVHDEIIIPVSQAEKAREIMSGVFEKEFQYFRISGEKKVLFKGALSTPATPFENKSLIQANEGVSTKKLPTLISIKPEVKRLHIIYSEAEENGLLEGHPDRNTIGSLWQGVMIYYHKPSSLNHYLEELDKIALTLNT